MENNNDFIKDWLEGKVSREELKSKKEQGDNTVNEFDELITRSSRLKVPENVTKEQAWKKFSDRIAEAPTQETKVVKLNRWIPLSIAASIALVVVAFFAFRNTTVTTQIAETKVQVLPDGSEVTLNADSKISFNKLGWSGDRKISLEGEAFFKVIKGSSFTVETTKGTVTVLGTSFNVNTRVSNFDVSCYTGKVSVVSNGKEVVITKGLFTKLDGNALTAAAAFDDNKATWRDGVFYFENEPLNNVIEELERQFGIEIILTNNAPRQYSGSFTNKNLDAALEMVFGPFGLSYQHETKNKIIVK